MLRVDNLHAFYGKSHVLHGVQFEVGQGEIVALLGRNGSGRSTTAKAVMGMVECHGEVTWKGQAIQGRKPYEIAFPREVSMFLKTARSLPRAVSFPLIRWFVKNLQS